MFCRYMVDVTEQGKGYGKAFLPMVIQQIRQQYGCKDLYTTTDDENLRAISLYESFGFVPTDEMDEEERIYVLRGHE